MLEHIRADLHHRLAEPGALNEGRVLYLYREGKNGLQVIKNQLPDNVCRLDVMAALPSLVDVELPGVGFYVWVSPGLPQEWETPPSETTYISLLLADEETLDCEVWSITPSNGGVPSRIDTHRYSGCDWYHPLEQPLLDGRWNEVAEPALRTFHQTMHRRWKAAPDLPSLPFIENTLVHLDLPELQ